MSEEMTRKIALYCMKAYSELHSEVCEECEIYGQTGCDHCFEDALQLAIASLETDEAYQLEYESTTKNDLGVEKIVDVLGSYTDLDIPYKREIAENILTKLSSVTPQPRKGHWIPVYQGDEIINYRCSECEFGNTFGKGTIGMNYCPHCGADMREVEE